MLGSTYGHCYSGQEKLAHGGAHDSDWHLCYPQHAAAVGLSLHPHQLLHQAGRDRALLPRRHLNQHQVCPANAQTHMLTVLLSI